MTDPRPIDRRKRATLAAIGAYSLAASTLARAQAYPSKPVKIVVSTGAGGISDVAVRLMAEDLGKRLDQQVVVENRPGANGLVAAQAVKNAQPDGYTFLCGELPKVSSVFVRNSVDALKEFVPVSRILIGDIFVYVPTAGNITSLKDLAAFAKANPGKLRVPSIASFVNMMTAILANRGGFQYEDIPYKTSGDAVLALLNGDGHVTLNGAAGFAPHVESGKLRVIGVLSAQRSAAFPTAPTAVEQGFPVIFNFEQVLWAPPGTPRPLVNQIAAAMAAVLKDPVIGEKYRKLGVSPAPSSPEQVAEKYRTDVALYAEAARLIRYQPE